MKHYLPLNNAYEVIRFANYLQDKYYKVLKIDLEDMTYIPLKDDSDDIYSKESLVDW